MFALAFDLNVANTNANHPKKARQAYLDIQDTLSRFGFERVQGSVYLTENEDLANLFSAVLALKQLAWLPHSVNDIRAFKVEHWSDFTKFVKS